MTDKPPAEEGRRGETRGRVGGTVPPPPPLLPPAPEAQTWPCCRCGTNLGIRTETMLQIGTAVFYHEMAVRCVRCGTLNHWQPQPGTAATQ